MKFSALPPFRVTGKVNVYQHIGLATNTTTLVVSVYSSDAWSIGPAMERAAQWMVESLGVPAEKTKAMAFEYIGTDELVAVEPRGIKSEWGERVEAYFDDSSLTTKKRATLIRQRRLVPHEHTDAIAIYAKPAAAKQEEVVTA